MPAGKAIAMAAMPTAVLMGIGFTPTLALADDAPTSKSLTADEYKDCVAALEDSASPSASASASPDASDDATSTPSPSASADSGSDSGSSSSDSGSDDKATPTPSPSASASKETSSSSDSADDTATPTPSASASDDGNLLTDIGDAITGIFTGGSSETASSSASPTPTPSASASAGADDTAKETTEKVTDTVNDTVKDTTDAASKAAEDTTKAVEDATKAAEDAADDATASPSPSASSTTSADDCPVATDEVGDVDNPVPLPNDPWYLEASSLLLNGADYQGVVEVRTANGKTKKVLKYVVDKTDIGDLHQLVKERGKTYHVQAADGSTSTFRDGKVTMYTESISGNLFGLIPITFSPDSPPPLNIPLIYFTNVKVTQAGQFGGTLHIPGMQVYTTEGTG